MNLPICFERVFCTSRALLPTFFNSLLCCVSSAMRSMAASCSSDARRIVSERFTISGCSLRRLKSSDTDRLASAAAVASDGASSSTSPQSLKASAHFAASSACAFASSSSSSSTTSGTSADSAGAGAGSAGAALAGAAAAGAASASASAGASCSISPRIIFLKRATLMFSPRTAIILLTYSSTVKVSSKMYSASYKDFILIFFCIRPSTIFSLIWSGLPIRSSDSSSAFFIFSIAWAGILSILTNSMSGFMTICNAMFFASSWNLSVLAAKSVSQLTSTITPSLEPWWM
mmetsp:Transcript_158135/g.274610  ORF Transcript_158135/g.274610 Transcript_158135/m.274610 type:complete len:289 (-) Transcript_158135:429-1295(-)